MNLALFDLDNTLLNGDSDFEWAQFLISKGVLDREVHEARNMEFFEHYKAGTLDIHAFLDFQLAPLARHARAELDAWHAEFLATRIRPLISPAARALVESHAEAGDLMAIVTATNSFVTGPIAREFGIPHLIATIPAQENGRFTGKPRGLPSFREGKITRVEAWLESLGLWLGGFEQSWFYSDSLNDLPLLEKVTHPVAVDADDTLARAAEERDWLRISLRG
jgi:HAD superfamily hydrolase (TIGR01490 family)